MQMALVTPAFQPYRGETGKAWMASEYGITADTSSLISSTSGTERDDTDEEILSFDLGPEPFDPTGQGRLSSDEWLDDFQQGLVPGGSEPRTMDYKYLAMPMKPSLLDMMRKDIEDTDEKWEAPPTSPERALTPTIGFSYDYATDAPPDIQRVGVGTPMHSSPYPEPPKLSARPGPVLLPPRPRSTSVPPIPMTVQKMAKRYMPVTENVTPPISPLRWILRPLPRLSAQEEAGVVASGAPLQAQLLVWEPEVKLDKRNSTQQKPRRHRPRAPCGQNSPIVHFRSSAWHATYNLEIDLRTRSEKFRELCLCTR